MSGGFSANFIPSGIDPLLAGLTEEAANIVETGITVNPLCNLYFTACSSVVIVLIGWFLTDWVVEPRLRGTPVDGDPESMPKMAELAEHERKALWLAVIAGAMGAAALFAWAWPADSALRGEGGALTDSKAPLMAAIVPWIFFLFLIPGVVYGYAAGTLKNHRDVIEGMSKSMSTMGYYIVMAFFASLFIYSFRESNVGLLVAVSGAETLQSMGLGAEVTLVGVIILCAVVNLLVGSASAKWALLAPVFVPMLMQLGLSPELTQAAYRVGDSTTNIITPLMPYFPLVVAFSKDYVKGTGLGTMISLMLPYSVVLIIGWSLFFLAYWTVGIPLGLGASYEYSIGG